MKIAVMILTLCTLFAFPLLSEAKVGFDKTPQYTDPFTSPDEMYWFEQAYLFSMSNKHREAIDALSKVIGINPKNTAAYQNRGSSYSELNEYENAIKDYSKVIEIDPKDSWGYYNLGAVYRDMRDYKRALDNFNMAIKLNPEAIGLKPENLSPYLLRGNTLISLGRCDEAMKDFKHILDKNPNDIEAIRDRGATYYHLGDYQQAIADFSKVIELDDKHEVAYFSRGAAYYSIASYKKAVKDFQKSIELNFYPEYSRIYILLSLRKTSEEKYKDYLEEFKSYVLKNKTDDWIRIVSKYYLALDNITEEDILAEAQKAKDAVRVQGRLCEAYYYIAEQRLSKGDRKGAEEYFKKAIETNTYSFYEYSLSEAMLKMMKEKKI